MCSRGYYLPTQTDEASYIRNFLSTGSLENGFCTVTDKRVYFRGKCYTKSGNKYKSTKEEKIVDLEDVTGTGFAFIKRFALMLAAILCTIWTVILTFVIVPQLPELAYSGYGQDFAAIRFLIFCAILPTIVLWVLFFLFNVKIFEISFAGGTIAFKASGYNEYEVNDFRRALHLAKDNYKQASNTVSNSWSYVKI